MHPIWEFIIILITINVCGIFGGLKIKDYIENKEDKSIATRSLFLAVAWLVGGLLVAVGSFLTIENYGRANIKSPKTGAFEINEKAPKEPTKEELKEDSKKKKTEEWGEVNEKSLEEIRDESNRSVEEAIRRNNNQ